MQMGLGLLGDPNIIFKRKFRWTFEVENICGGLTVPPSFVKMASRPNLEIEEIVVDYLNARTWIPGKGSWNTIQVTYYDVTLSDANAGDAAANAVNLLTWIRSVYDFGDPVQLNNGSNRNDYAGTGILYLYDGCGNPIESWQLGDMWPQAIEFGELAYEDSGIAEIQLTLRYSNVLYTPLCGPNGKPPCCTGCN